MATIPLPSRRSRLAVATIFFVNGAVLASWVAHIPGVKERHGIGDGSLGLVLLFMALGAVLALPLGGWLVDRFGSRLITSLAALVFCLALPWPLLSRDVTCLVTALVLLGACNAVLDVSMNAKAVAVERRYQRSIMSSFHALWSLGGVVGAALSGLAMSLDALPARYLVATAIVAAAFVSGTLGWLVPSEPRRDGVAHIVGPPSRRLLGLGLVAFLGLLAEGAMGDWNAVYLHDALGQSGAAAATGFAAFSLAMAVGRLGGGRRAAEPAPRPRHRQRLLRARRRTGRQRSAALADACLETLHPGGLEGGDDRHAIHDLARQHQPQDVTEREGANLDEFRLVVWQLKLHHLLAQEEVSSLVHDALARVVGAHVSQPAGPIPDLLRQLALGGLLDRLPGVDSASGHLPRRPARHVPVLPDQEDGVRIEERKDAHALSAAHDTVDRGASIGQLHEVLPKGEPAILVNGPRGCRLPGDLREPSHPCRSRKNARVCRGESPSDAASAIRSRARSSDVSMSYHAGRHATRSPFASARRMVSGKTRLVLHAIASKSSRYTVRSPIR